MSFGKITFIMLANNGELSALYILPVHLAFKVMPLNVQAVAFIYLI